MIIILVSVCKISVILDTWNSSQSTTCLPLCWGVFIYHHLIWPHYLIRPHLSNECAVTGCSCSELGYFTAHDPVCHSCDRPITEHSVPTKLGQVKLSRSDEAI